MSYNSDLETKIDRAVARWKDLEKKKMFGGVGYLLRGNMAVGIWKDFLIVRMDKERAAKRLAEKNVRPFDITGRPMAGWIMVAEPGWKSAAGLAAWLRTAKAFAAALPEKQATIRKKKTLREYRR